MDPAATHEISEAVKAGVQSAFSGIPTAADKEPFLYILLLFAGVLILAFMALGVYVGKYLVAFVQEQSEKTSTAINQSAQALEGMGDMAKSHATLIERCTRALEKLGNGNGH
jgi:hypothetical protein